jgi:hypothetical protein
VGESSLSGKTGLIDSLQMSYSRRSLPCGCQFLASLSLRPASALGSSNPFPRGWREGPLLRPGNDDSIAAKRVLNTGNQQVFAKREPNGDAIVGLFNTGGKAEEVSVPASTEALPENRSGYSLHDLWTGETKKTTNTINAVVPSHGVVLYRVSGL